MYLLKTYCVPVWDMEVSKRPSSCSHGASDQVRLFLGAEDRTLSRVRAGVEHPGRSLSVLKF